MPTGSTLPTNTIYFLPVQYVASGSTTFTFQVGDTGGVWSSNAVVTANIKHINQPPSASAVTSVSVDRSVPYPISLSTHDYDTSDSETFVIPTYSAGAGGQFAVDANGVPSQTTFGQAPVTLSPSVTVNSNGNANAKIWYTAPFNQIGNNYASVTFYVKDAGALSSSNITVTVNINPNNAPVAQPVSIISVNEHQTSNTVTLFGKDADYADSTTLQVMIYSLPTKGTLLLSSGTSRFFCFMKAHFKNNC